MTLYHDTKDGALLAGAPLADLGFKTRVELEPDNGWVLVVLPTCVEHLAQITDAWLDWCEVDLSIFKGRLCRRPANYKKAQPLERKKTAPPPPPPPPPSRKGTKE